MNKRPSSQARNPFVLLMCIVGFIALGTRNAEGQDISIFTALGNFVSGFDGSVFIGPAGFLQSDVFRERDELQEFGVFALNPKAGLLIGFDVLTGIASKVEGFDVRGGSVLALPTIMVVHGEPLYVRGLPPVWANFGFGVGLSQLLNMKTQAFDLSETRLIDVKASGFHAALTCGISTYIANGFGLFLDGSLRYTTLPTVEYVESGKPITPLGGWPSAITFRSGTIRFGVGIGT